MGELKSKEKVEARLRRRKRIRSHLAGTSDRPRLNVFRSLANIYVQVIDDAKGITLVSASTLDKDVVSQIQGKNKTDAARIVGKVAAERAKNVGITKVVFDRGGYKYHGRIAAVAEGAREAGLEF